MQQRFLTIELVGQDDVNNHILKQNPQNKRQLEVKKKQQSEHSAFYFEQLNIQLCWIKHHITNTNMVQQEDGLPGWRNIYRAPTSKKKTHRRFKGGTNNSDFGKMRHFLAFVCGTRLV